MKRPKFSIITICKNEEDYIEKTIQSVINQEFCDFEFIIIDGKSTDSTLDIIEKYKEKIDLIISEKDSGIYSAMNKGISHAKGDFLCFMNANDFFYDNKTLSRVNEIIEKTPEAELIFGEGQYKDFKAQKVIQTDFSNWQTCYDIMEKYSLFHQSMYFKRELFEKFGLYREDFKIASDYFFTFKCLIKGKVKTKYINEVLSIRTNEGIGSCNKKVLYKEVRKTKNYFFPFYAKFCPIIKLLRFYHPVFYKKYVEKVLNKIKNRKKINYV